MSHQVMRVRSAIVGAVIVAGTAPLSQTPPDVTVGSPSGEVVLRIASSPDAAQQNRLTWQATVNGNPAIESSALGILVDGRDLGLGATITRSEPYEIDETYPWRGVHSMAVNRAHGARLTALHPPTKTTYTVDVRVADDAVAIRYVVPGTGRRVPDAAMGFRVPAGSIVWSHGLRDHYEAVYDRRAIEEVPPGDWAAPPVTIQLPAGTGYVAIMEADLRNYAGMALQADGRGGYRERLAHDHPPGYPYVLRFGVENATRLTEAASIEGTITTPWRVVILGRDLDRLVNSDAVHNLCAPPDPKLFPEGIRADWLKPGRAVWRYLDGGDGGVAGIKEFSRLAGALGFEYQVIEGQWQRWTEQELREVVEYSRAQGVRLLVWRHRNTLGDPGRRRALFASLRKAGVAGLKVDFLDHEAKEVIDLYQDILRDAAEHQLLVNFHGSNKPAGEPRTWPNEMTREGIYGLEHRRMEAWAGFNATFPFVRMLAGHADYTPVVFGERRRDTSWAHQIASAAILTSPLLVYGGHPASLLSNPAAGMIKAIPSVWDETRVLPPSEIGVLALFARRSGEEWFVAAMNGPVGRTLRLDLSFLSSGAYRALIVRDDMRNDAAVQVETRDIPSGVPLEVPVRPAGGFVIRLTPTGR